MAALHHILKTAATTLVVAFVVSCGGKLKEAEVIDLSSTPIQQVEDMFAVQTHEGVTAYRMEAELMERFETDTTTVETFPKGLSVYGYTEDGLLETIILSDNARHSTYKKTDGEVWQATGNVSIQNVIKQETMETDTLYWDREKAEIYTDSYIRMYSSEGFMQGYGMRSDDHARNSVILKPFNSFGVVAQDTTKVVIDSVNFIGPFLKK